MMARMGTFGGLAVLLLSVLGLFAAVSAENKETELHKPNIYANMGICWIMGNPHYRTFDNHYYNFMGNCTYTLAKNCHVDSNFPTFEVEVQNQNRANSKVPIIERVVIKVHGYTFTVYHSEYGLVRYEDALWNLPMFVENSKVQVYLSGQSLLLETDFGLSLEYDWNQYLVVMVPRTFMGKTCGMCGNFNNKGDDDLVTPSGKAADSAEALAKSWRVPGVADDASCRDECEGECQKCKFHNVFDDMAGRVFCGLLTKIMNGPLKLCSAVIPPSMYNAYCLYDVCMGQGMRNFLCNTLQVYTDACQRAGVRVFDWRPLAGCPLPKCPKNSHFEQCGVACPATCEDPGAPSKCRAPCVEGCTCDKGFVRRGNQCVPESQCGCLYKPTGSYLAPGKSFWADENCRTKCTCDSGDGEVKCKASECPYEDARLTQCKVVKGIRGCYPVKYGKCSILGDPHYYTFDNRTYNFQGTCTYTAAKTCHVDGTDLTPFSVVVENEKWYAMSKDPKVSVAKLVAVTVYGQTLVLRRNQIGKIMVDGVLTNLPLNLNDGQIQAYQDGMQDVIITDFGLKVTYDLVYYVTVTVPSSYHGKTCGLCGNFNGNKDDDFQLPDGKETNDIKDFGAAWKVGVEGVVCDDGCSGDLCPKCDEKKKRIFESDCSIIRNPSGPFAACLNVIDPEPYFRDCVYDVCVGEGDRDMLCHSIASYVSDCQDFGVPIKNWRTPTFCSLTCPAHSHYQVCAETCNTPCPGLTSVVSCPPTCAEGCACDFDYYFNGTGCVKLDMCSCYFDGQTYQIGETVVTKDCRERYSCQPSGVVKQEHMQCKSNEICKEENQARGCFPKQCSIRSDGKTTLFEGLEGTIEAMGAYEIVKVCDGMLEVEWFRVVADLQMCKEFGKRIMAVYAFFEDGVVIVNDKHETWFNGKKINLPSLLQNGVSIRVSAEAVVIEKVNGLRMSYNTAKITVSVGDQIADKVCGACGSVDGDSVFDVKHTRFTDWMHSWLAPDFPTCPL